MKCSRRPNRVTLAMVSVLVGSLLPLGCGSDGSSPRTDGSADVKMDSSGPRLDGGAVDQAADRVATSDVGLPNADAVAADLPIAPDAVPAIDTVSDDAVLPEPDAPTPAQPDASQPDNAIPVDVEQLPDVIWPVDLSSPDVPLGEDLPVTTVDVSAEDSPLVLHDAPSLDTEPTVDGGAVDGAGLDGPTVDGAGAGVVTGWPTATLDFGLNPCGGDAPASQTFTLTNSGATTVTISTARFTGTAGYSSDAQGKTIQAGGTLVVTIHAPGVPQVSAIPSTFDDILTIETDLPSDDQHLIHVTEAARGAVLAWNTAAGFGSFGSVSPGYSTRADFQAVNSGNLPAQVAISVAAPFAVTVNSPVTIAAGGATDGAVVFTPSTGGAATGTLVMTLANPVALCQPLPSSLALTGTSVNGAISLSSLLLNFATECHAVSPATQALTITNTGAATMTWAAALAAGNQSVFQLSSTGSTLTPQTGSPAPSTTVTITPASPTNATTITDTINVTTDAMGDTVHKVVLTQTPLGDVISVLGNGSIDLGSVPITSPALTSPPVTLSVHNNANTKSASAVVTLQMTGSGAAYYTVTPAQLTIAPGKQAEVSVTFSPGTNPAIVTSGNHIDLTANLHWHVGSEANCGSASGDIAATATATLAQISGISGQLDFGLVNCGATGLQRQITVTNSGTADCQITNIVLANSTYYTVDYPTLPKALGPGGSAVITVTPNAVPATVTVVPDHARYDGSLTITTDAIGDSPHTVDLLMGAQGAIITNQPSTTDWNFGTANSLETRKLYVPVVNTGNVPVTAALQDIIIATPQIAVFSLASPSTLAAGQTSNIVAVFQPNEAGSTFTATADLMLSVASNTVFCQPLPAGWNSTTHNIHMQGQSASTH